MNCFRKEGNGKKSQVPQSNPSRCDSTQSGYRGQTAHMHHLPGWRRCDRTGTLAHPAMHRIEGWKNRQQTGHQILGSDGMMRSVAP